MAISDKIIQVLPANVPVHAVFAEEERKQAYPVVCWAVVRTVSQLEIYEDDESQNIKCHDVEVDVEVKGMIICGDFPQLFLVDDDEMNNEFEGYEYG